MAFRAPGAAVAQQAAGHAAEVKAMSRNWSDQNANNRRRCVYHLQKLARDWGIGITVHPKGGAA